MKHSRASILLQTCIQIQLLIITLLTGSLNLPPTGNASAALFNRMDLWPLLLTTSTDGRPGLLNQMLSEQIKYIAPKSDPRGIVFAIAVAVIAVLVSIIIIGEVAEICRWHWPRMKGYSYLTTTPKRNLNRSPCFRASHSSWCCVSRE